MRPSATAGLTQSAHSGITRGTSPVHAGGVHVSPMSTCPLAQVSLRSDEACPGIGGAVAGAGPSTARRRRPAMIASRLVLISLGQSGPATMCPIWAGIQPDDSSPLVNVAREVHQGSSELQAASPWPKRSSGRSWRTAEAPRRAGSLTRWAGLGLGVLGQSQSCPGNRFVGDCLCTGSPALIGVFVDIAMVTCKITSAVNLQCDLAEWDPGFCHFAMSRALS